MNGPKVDGQKGNNCDSDVYGKWKKSFASWIGLNGMDTEGTFKWSDGQDLGKYTKWTKGEPNDHIIKAQNNNCLLLVIFLICFDTLQ